MGFKKLDSAAVLASINRPVDAFVLQQEADNLATAHTARGRHIAQAYSATSTGYNDNLPVLAAPWHSALPVAVWPVSADCTQLELQLHGLATAAVGETNAIYLRTALQGLSGDFVVNENTLTVAGSVSNQTLTFSIDVRAHQAQVVVVWLCFDSVAATSTPPSGTQAGTDISQGGTRIDLSAVSYTYSSSKRYRLRFTADGAGTAPRNQAGYPGIRMIQRLFSGSLYDVIPALPEFAEGYAAFDVSVEEIGRLQVLGWCLTETDFAALPDLTVRCRPAGRLRAGACQDIYRRGYRLHSQRTRIYSAAPAPRLAGWQQWLQKIEINTTTQRDDVYVSALGALPTYKVHEDSTVPSAQYRRRYRVLALYAMATTEPFNGRVTAAITLNSFTGTAWSADVVTPDLQQEVQTAPALVYDTRGQISALSLRTYAGDLAYCAWSVGDLLRGDSGVRILDVQFEEDTAQQAVAARLMRLGLVVTDELGTGDPVQAPMLALPCATVLISEGL